MERRFAARDGMAAVARAAFGPGRRLEAMQRLRGGSKKGVYRLTFDDETSVIGYVWDAAENYWPDRHDGDSAAGDDNPFSAASGTGLFETAHALLGRLGVRTPRIYLLDRSRASLPADMALVEDVRGGTLEAQLELGLPGAGQAMARLGSALQVMPSSQPDFRQARSGWRRGRHRTAGRRVSTRRRPAVL